MTVLLHSMDPFLPSTKMWNGMRDANLAYNMKTAYKEGGDNEFYDYQNNPQIDGTISYTANPLGYQRPSKGGSGGGFVGVSYNSSWSGTPSKPWELTTIHDIEDSQDPLSEADPINQNVDDSLRLKYIRELRSMIRHIINEEYYSVEQNNFPNLNEIIIKWVEQNKKIKDPPVNPDFYNTKSFSIPPKELWPFREFTWSRSTARGGKIRMIDGKRIWFPGKVKWDLMEDLLDDSENWESPIVLAIGKNRTTKIIDGNHRLAVAKEIEMESVPVHFEFYEKVPLTRDINVLNRMSISEADLARFLFGSEHEEARQYLEPRYLKSLFRFVPKDVLQRFGSKDKKE